MEESSYLDYNLSDFSKKLEDVLEKTDKIINLRMSKDVTDYSVEVKHLLIYIMGFIKSCEKFSKEYLTLKKQKIEEDELDNSFSLELDNLQERVSQLEEENEELASKISEKDFYANKEMDHLADFFMENISKWIKNLYEKEKELTRLKYKMSSEID
jgi:hypothetical protein